MPRGVPKPLLPLADVLSEIVYTQRVRETVTTDGFDKRYTGSNKIKVRCRRVPCEEGCPCIEPPYYLVNAARYERMVKESEGTGYCSIPCKAADKKLLHNCARPECRSLTPLRNKYCSKLCAGEMRRRQNLERNEG